MIGDEKEIKYKMATAAVTKTNWCNGGKRTINVEYYKLIIW